MKHLKEYIQQNEAEDLNRLFVRHAKKGNHDELDDLIQHYKKHITEESVGISVEKTSLNGYVESLDLLLREFQPHKHFIDIALLNACTNGHIQVAESLFKYMKQNPDIVGSDPDDEEDEGVNIYHDLLWAIKHGYVTILKIAKKYDFLDIFENKYNHWKVAMKNSQWDVIYWMVRNTKYDVNQLVLELLPWRRTYGFAMIIQHNPAAMNVVNMQKNFDLF
jgi:hypothetical protein